MDNHRDHVHSVEGPGTIAARLALVNDQIAVLTAEVERKAAERKARLAEKTPNDEDLQRREWESRSLDRPTSLELEQLEGLRARLIAALNEYETGRRRPPTQYR
jgi:uncharacterized small protein (DUF1192 family)